MEKQSLQRPLRKTNIEHSAGHCLVVNTSLISKGTVIPTYRMPHERYELDESPCNPTTKLAEKYDAINSTVLGIYNRCLFSGNLKGTVIEVRYWIHIGFYS